MFQFPKKKGPRDGKPAASGKMLLRVGDTVRVLSGKDKGKEGKINEVKPGEAKVVVEGINIAIKHQKPRPTAAGTTQGGGRIETAMPLHASKVALIDPADGGRTTRLGTRTNAAGARERFARKSGSILDNGK